MVLAVGGVALGAGPSYAMTISMVKDCFRHEVTAATERFEAWYGLDSHEHEDDDEEGGMMRMMWMLPPLLLMVPVMTAVSCNSALLYSVNVRLTLIDVQM